MHVGHQTFVGLLQTGKGSWHRVLRFNVVSVVLPALRERPEDLPLLIESFLGAAANRLGRPPRPLEAGAYRALLAHEWPGNVRELEHALEHAAALASGERSSWRTSPQPCRTGWTPDPGMIWALPVVSGMRSSVSSSASSVSSSPRR